MPSTTVQVRCLFIVNQIAGIDDIRNGRCNPQRRNTAIELKTATRLRNKAQGWDEERGPTLGSEQATAGYTKGVVQTIGVLEYTTPLVLILLIHALPRVARTSQPWALIRNPVGIANRKPQDGHAGTVHLITPIPKYLLYFLRVLGFPYCFRNRSTLNRTRMKKAPKDTAGQPHWKTSWPRNGEPKLWFKCGVSKCECIADDEIACEKATALIDALGRSGATADAMKAVNRLIRRLPATDRNFRYRRLALSGAQAAFDGGDFERMEKYLALVAKQNKFFTRPCDLNHPLQQVDDFKIQKGILNPPDAIDEERCFEATFTWHQRLLKTSPSKAKAAKYLAEMEAAVKNVGNKYLRERLYQDLLIEYGRLGDQAAVRRIVRSLDKEVAARVLDYKTAWRMGETNRSLRIATTVVKKALAELAEMEDPNIHFPVGRISRAILWLVEVNELNRATKLFRLVNKNITKWPVYGYGWVTAVVYGYLGNMALAVGDSESALWFANAGLGDASEGKRSSFNKSVEASLLKLIVSCGMESEALKIASKLRSPKQKRLETAKILVRAKRWSELRDVCKQVKSPEEAADLAWSLRFEFPGGEPV